MTMDPISILLVEDNPDHAALVMRGLASNQIANRIVHVEDGETALNYVQKRGEYAGAPTPQLILLDLRLPKVDGLEVLKILKSNDDTKRIPIVILTTSDAERDVAMAYDCHANSYMVKPVTFESFMELTKTLGFYWLVYNKQLE
jgi:DNA-binding response OmpR family regulator